MTISMAGLLVFLLLLSLGHLLGAPLLIGLLASMAFGATAIATLTMVGGSSPLIYTAFAGLLVIKVLSTRRLRDSLMQLVANDRTTWIVLLLLFYTLVGAMAFPRLFAGETSVFVLARTPMGGRIAEVPLGPVSGNITQSGYFALNCFTFIAISVFLQQKTITLQSLRKGFLALAAMNLLLGVIDLLGKVAGFGDLLGPIRTASYSMLVAVEQSGFWRIVGGFPEASSFATATLVSAAFTITYWRTTSSRLALFLSLGLSVLLVLSTSSSGYVAGAFMGIVLALSMLVAFARSMMSRKDITILGLVAVLTACLLSAYLYDERLFEPLARLFDSTIWSKAQSGSAQERAYWNMKSIDSFIDTYGVGIGMGSSRASSWLVALISQLGLIGAVLVSYLIFEVLRPIAPTPARKSTATEIYALGLSVQASVLAGIAVLTLIGGSADPGLLFFVSLAVVRACRQSLRKATPRAADPVLSPIDTSIGRRQVLL